MLLYGAFSHIFRIHVGVDPFTEELLFVLLDELRVFTHNVVDDLVWIARFDDFLGDGREVRFVAVRVGR